MAVTKETQKEIEKTKTGIKTKAKEDKKPPDMKPKKRRIIRRVADVKNSELRDIATILCIRTTIPRTQEDRQNLIRKIRRLL